MKYAILLLLASCAGVLPVNTCNITIAGDFDDRFAATWLTPKLLQEGVDRALDAASTTTDFRLNDQISNCEVLSGYRVYTKSEGMWIDGSRTHADGSPQWVAGQTYCWQKLIIISTPLFPTLHWSSLVHELIHAMQHCESVLPVDSGSDEAHANWYRDEIYQSLERVNVNP